MMLCRKIISTNIYWLIISQKLPLSTKSSLPPDTSEITSDGIPKKKAKKRSFYSKEVYNFLKEKSPKYADLIPKCVIRKTVRDTPNVCVIDERSAKALAAMICEELLKDSSYVIECNPGLGLLTKELLRNGVPYIHLYEAIKPFYEADGSLFELLKKHPDRLMLKTWHFHKVWRTLLRDKALDLKVGDVYMAGLPTSEWKNSSYMQMIHFCPSRLSVALVVHNFFNQTDMFERGRPCFYLAIPSIIWQNFNKVNCSSYSQYNVILEIFFDSKVLGELPREVFVPWPSEKYKFDNLNSPMSIVKLEPKKEALDILEKDEIMSFWYFAKHCLKARKIKVLAEFEKFVPGSGVKLIQKGCGILTSFKEVPPQKMLEIFKMYKSWPEYDDVMFNPTLTAAEEKKDDEKLEHELEDEVLEGVEQETADLDNPPLPADAKQEKS